MEIHLGQRVSLSYDMIEHYLTSHDTPVVRDWIASPDCWPYSKYLDEQFQLNAVAQLDNIVQVLFRISSPVYACEFFPFLCYVA
jgi:hypothetical protein